MERSEVWWAELPGAAGCGSAVRRPVVIVSSNAFNQSRIRTVIAVVLTTNLQIAEAPGSVLIGTEESGLPKDSVAIVSQVVTLNKHFLIQRSGRLPPRAMKAIENGLRLVLSL